MMRRALIVGRASRALEEYVAARALGDFDEVLVVGAMSVTFPDRVDHLVSFHADFFDSWAAQRAAAGLPPAGCYWGARYRGRNLGEGKTRARPLRYVECVGGSSGFVAVQAALGPLACGRVVLAGVPMRAADAHVGDAAPWDEADAYWSTWQERMVELRGRVRSMSGRTREALGEPTREWLHDSDE